MLVNLSAHTDTRCKNAGILFPQQVLKMYVIAYRDSENNP